MALSAGGAATTQTTRMLAGSAPRAVRSASTWGTKFEGAGD